MSIDNDYVWLKIRHDTDGVDRIHTAADRQP